jgi:hypothetical protein
MSRQKSHDVKSLPNWDLVIDESVRHLQACEARASHLRVCLEYFRKRKESGDPFPGKDVLRNKHLIPQDELVGIGTTSTS